jgi:gamma-glutamyltranspeptidase/glutathione hydrolase
LPDSYRESESTTHFSIVDSAGNAISLTYTINTSFGSKLVVDGAGFLLNNEMDDFSIKPGVPNAFGLVGGTANEIAPDKRMLSSMSPTIVMKNKRPYLVLGSPGGSKIITSVAETILNVVRFDMSLNDAVSQARFHHQWLPDTLYMEEGGFTKETRDKLAASGHAVKERSRYSDIQAVEISPEGLMIGASDPRGDGAAAAF